MMTLGAFAKYVRSKNAGPFWMTLDVFFETKEDFYTIADRNIITPELISGLFGTPPEQVRIFLCDNVNTIKISIPRPVIQGSLDDKDIHAGQQYVLLSNVEVTV
jgi:hypothetical protein